jgi:ATP/ADP translocase
MHPHKQNRRLDATLVKNLQKRPKSNLSMQESAQFLMKSRYLRYMATLVLGASLLRLPHHVDLYLCVI